MIGLVLGRKPTIGGKMSHRYDIPLHRNLQSSARWHGRRVGTALAARDIAVADYEYSFARRTAQSLTLIESADYWYIFDLSRASAIRKSRERA